MNVVTDVGRLLVPVAVASIFALSRRCLPPSSEISFTSREAGEFSGLQWLVVASMLCSGFAFGLLTYKALLWTNAALATHEAHNQFLILPGHWIWFFLPFFGGICLCWELTLRLWKLLGNSLRARKYESWSNAKTGFNATRVLRIMSITLVLPIAVATVLALPIHTSFDDGGMAIGHFGALHSKKYSYSNINRITVTKGLRLRDGSLEKRPAITIDFVNGDRWSSADNRDPEKSIDDSLLIFLQKKTQLPVTYIEAFPFGFA